jgi:hypothetical protein
VQLPANLLSPEVFSLWWMDHPDLMQKLTDLQFNADRIAGTPPSLEQKVCS